MSPYGLDFVLPLFRLASNNFPLSEASGCFLGDLPDLVAGVVSCLVDCAWAIEDDRFDVSAAETFGLEVENRVRSSFRRERKLRKIRLSVASRAAVPSVARAALRRPRRLASQR